MTMPNERSRAIRHTREFLRSLLNPKETPRIPKEIRRRAYRCLKHYPWDWHINQAAKVVPDEFGPLADDEVDEIIKENSDLMDDLAK